jgi:membrane protease YdiL (CAAX protease family)
LKSSICSGESSVFFTGNARLDPSLARRGGKEGARDASSDQLCHSLDVLRWGRFAAAYALIGVASAAVALAWRGNPLFHPQPLIALGETQGHVYSLAVGLTLGALIVMLTRLMVPRFEWARRLHRELRPIARAVSPGGIVALALLSAFGEELLFRGLLQPWVGVVPQALIFGLLHQMRGPSRWVWAGWATAVGLLLGVVFQVSGSLIGPIAAHALINGLNLWYLKSHDPEPQRRSLGGLLGQRG